MVGAHDTHAPEALPAGVHGWTAPAMMRLFLAYLADGRIRLDGLTTTVAGEDAAAAYTLIARERGRVLGVELGQCRSVGALPGSAEHQLGCKMLLAQQAILAQALQQNGIGGPRGAAPLLQFPPDNPQGHLLCGVRRHDAAWLRRDTSRRAAVIDVPLMTCFDPISCM